METSLSSVLRCSYKITDFLCETHHNSNSDDRNQRIIFIGLSLFGVALLIIMGVLHFSLGEFERGLWCLGYLGILIGSSLLLRYFKDIHFAFQLKTAIGLLVFGALVYQSHSLKMAVIWFYVFPVFSMAAFGRWEGRVWCLASLAVLAIILFGMDYQNQVELKSLFIRLQLFVSYIFVVGLTYFLEFIRGDQLERNATENYYLKKKLNDLNYQLSHQKRSQKKTEEKMFEIAQKVNIAKQAKNEFLSNINHELRTPLHGVLGFTELLRKKVRKLDKDLIEGYLDKIYTGGQKLMKLIEDLTSLSTLESGTASFVFQKAEMTQVIRSILSDFSRAFEKKGIRVSIEPEEDKFLVAVDVAKIKEVLRHILSNSLKLVSVNGRIVISLSIKNSYLNCSISDDGTGLPPSELREIFHSFVVGGNNMNERQGLGFAICYQIIKSHRGYIWGEPNEKGGTTITFKLPYLLR